MVPFPLKLHAAVILTGCVALLLSSCSKANRLPTAASNSPGTLRATRAFDHSHAALDGLLKKHVKNGLVNYQGILAESDVLSGYVNSLGAADAPTVNTWSREEQMAYWMNAYNAFTLQAVIERYPIKRRSLIGLFFPRNSILQIPGIWNRLTFNAGGETLTLGRIEHGILRQDFEDPRIHFAIVCASNSCPALRPEAYRFDRLERQLDEQTIDFINDPTRGVRWDADNRRLHVSRIFKWFRKDFIPDNTSVEHSKQQGPSGDPVIAFIRRYLQDESIIAALVENEDVRLVYLPYDWHLNERSGDRSAPESRDADA